MLRAAGDMDLVDDTVAIAGRALRILRPRDSDALLDERAFDHEQLLPYWADIWPSGIALARALAGRALRGARVLELGCGGMALPSIVASFSGGRVLASDWSPDAVALAERNAARNGARLETAVWSWAEPAAALARGPWDLILAADVLYERRTVDLLLELLPRLVAGRGAAWIADPGRGPAQRFLDTAATRFVIASTDVDGGPVAIHRLRARTVTAP